MKILILLSALLFSTSAYSECVEYNKLSKENKTAVFKLFNFKYEQGFDEFPKPPRGEVVQEIKTYCYDIGVEPKTPIYAAEWKQFLNNNQGK